MNHYELAADALFVIAVILTITATALVSTVLALLVAAALAAIGGTVLAILAAKRPAQPGLTPGDHGPFTP